MFGTILMQRVVSAALCAATLVGLPSCSVLQTPEADRTRPAQTQAPERTPPDDITFGAQTMNTWHTFEHCLDYFRYFAPSSGGPIGNGEVMADIVRNSGHTPGDFFIFTASGTDDFAYSGFKSGVMAMAETDVFTLADSERDGNLSFREREGYAHDGQAANEYMYNALRFFWN